MVDQIKRSPKDIFGWPIVGALFKNSKVVMAVRLGVLALFLAALYFGFLYTSKEENPFTTAVFWSLFWPFFMIVSLVTLGPAFCGICPHRFVGSYLTKFGLNKPMPAWLKKRGAGLALLILLYWVPVYLFPGLLKTPWIASLLFLVLTIIAFASYYLYKDMEYCNTLCPIGAVTKAYGKVGFAQLSTYQSACSECKTFECTKACDSNLQPYLFEKKNSMRDCTLCMDCADACEAVAFTVTKPSKTLFVEIKDNHTSFTWVYIWLLAVITFSMRFHHGLGHSPLKKELPWYHSGVWLEGIFGKGVDWVGFSALAMAIAVTFVLVFAGFKLASLIMKREFRTFLHHSAYALAPLMLLGSLSHVGTFFFLHYASDIANAYYWIIGSDEVMKPLATFRDKWVHMFGLISYVAALWGALLLYRRIGLLGGTLLQRLAAFGSAGLIIWFYTGLLVLQKMAHTMH